MITTPYIDQLLKLTPTFTDLIPHRNFGMCALELEEFAEFNTGSELIVVTGPSQAGKSLLLRVFVKYLLERLYRDADPKTVPVLGACANLAREGRTAAKYVYGMLLGDAGSPLFDAGKVISAAGYRPLRAMTEENMLAALIRALCILETRYVIADEAQFMIRAKSEEFRGSLIESLKSLVSYGRTLVLVGGYEVAKAVLEYREHMASRPTIVHLARYRNTEDDVRVWLQILKSFSESETLHFEDDRVLLRLAEPLLEECHGETGILQHRMARARCRARVIGTPITERIIRETRPTQHQWTLIRASIDAGEETLNDLVDVFGRSETAKTNACSSASSSTKDRKSKSKRKPFTAKPRRAYDTVNCV